MNHPQTAARTVWPAMLGTAHRGLLAGLRHTRQSTTADIFTHVLAEVRRGTAAHMDSLLADLRIPGWHPRRSAKH